MDQHDLIADLKAIAVQLGKVPSRDEYLKNTRITSRRQIDRVFGSFTSFILASGLGKSDREERKAEKRRAKRRVKNFFSSSVRPDTPTEKETAPLRETPPPLEVFQPTIAIPDLHCPWWDVGGVMLALQYIKHFYARGELLNVVQLGDAYDFYAAARFPRSHLLLNPGEEVEKGRKQLEWFWAEVHRIAPKANKYQLLGNHDLRPHKKILQDAPELEAFYDFKPLFDFPNVTTHHTHREPLLIGTVAYIHGFLSQKGRHRSKLLTHVVHGHTHKGNLEWSKMLDTGRWLFELDCGLLGDASSKPLGYTSVKETKWTKGVGYIGRYGPRFINFE